eukprot:gene160-65_t
MQVHLKTPAGAIRVASVYGPTYQRPEREKEAFLEDLSKVSGAFIMGDCNARPGQKSGSAVGPFGLGTRNYNGGKLVEWCEANGQRVCNTFFQKKRKGTWQHASSQQWFEIDLVMCSYKDFKKVADVHVWSERYGTDHRLVTTRLEIAMTRKHAQDKKAAKRVKLDVVKFKQDKIREEYEEKVARRLQLQGAERPGWARLKDIMLETAKEVVGERKARKRPQWQEECQDEIQTHVEKKKAAFDTYQAKKTKANLKKYRQQSKQTRQELRKILNRWWQQKAQEMDEGLKAKSTFDVFRAARELAGIFAEPRKVSRIRKKDGTFTQTPDETKARWVEHFEGVLNMDNAIRQETIESLPQYDVLHELAKDLTREEVESALGHAKCGKAPGLDDIPVELMKYGGEALVEMIHEVVLEFWRAGKVPQELKDAEMIPLPKKGDTTECDNSRGIALLATCGKVLTYCIARRLEVIVNKVVSDDQNGFRRGRSTVDGIHICRRIFEKHMQAGAEVHAGFIDLTKAYDTVPRNAMWQVLRKWGVPEKLVSLIASIHEGMQVSVRVGQERAEPFEVRVGLRQGCTLAPTLFILYFAAVTHAWETRGQAGVQMSHNINGHLTRKADARARGEVNVRRGEFADDMVVYTCSKKDMHRSLLTFSEVASEFGLMMSWKKTKTVSNREKYDLHFTDSDGHEQKVEGVASFPFLGTELSNDASMDAEIESRITKAAKVWWRLDKHVWKNRHISKNTKASIYRVTVLAALLYSAEAWPDLTNRQAARLECFHNRCIRRITGVSRMKQTEWHVTDEQLRGRLMMETVEELVRQRKLRWAGHLARMDANRKAKQITFSWVKGSKRNAGGKYRVDFARGVHRALKDREIPEADWYRQAQQRSEWRSRAVYGILPGQMKKIQAKEPDKRSKKHTATRKDAYEARQLQKKPDKRATGRLTDLVGVQCADGWKCPACAKVFATRTGFSSHYSKIHGTAEIERVEAGGSLQCGVCQQSFRNQGALTRHTRQVHAQLQENLTCECGKLMKSLHGLKLHQK